MEQSQAEAIIRRNAQVIAGRLRGGARYSLPSTFEALLHDPRAGGAGKMAAQHPDNPVGQFCYYHFSRIARLLRTQHPLYRRDLMPGQHRLPFWPALVSYLSFKSTALRNAARLGVTLAVGSSLGRYSTCLSLTGSCSPSCW